MTAAPADQERRRRYHDRYASHADSHCEGRSQGQPVRAPTDTPPGSVATFLDFNAGGGGCAGTPE